MFKLNRPIRTTKGELVIPIFVEGRLVHAIDRDKKQRMFDLSDFNFESKKNPKPKKQDYIMVKESVYIEDEIEEERIFNQNESGYLGGELYEEKPIVVQPSNPIPTPTPTPEINEEPIELETQDKIIEDTPAIIKDDKPKFFYSPKLPRIKTRGKSLYAFEKAVPTIIEADDFYGGW